MTNTLVSHFQPLAAQGDVFGVAMPTDQTAEVYVSPDADMSDPEQFPEEIDGVAISYHAVTPEQAQETYQKLQEQYPEADGNAQEDGE